eukprot:NODE_2533_length_907_cov_171.966200_g2080_i0.p1 GENE.NODE_2533_length_907_cov_171.966200_g2080_i0~~NODE_2533_length_907_cov_171.966200_g2080_i0.p1  ORF type:complete len:140 (-),score=48.76 NODE_2533_length_907_cov_171.966200_g2080_i0:215-634(-)
MLADEEAKHYKAIEQLRVSGDEMMDKPSSILSDTRSIFQQIQDDPKVSLLSSKDQMALYEGARDLEARNRDFYVEQAKDAKNPKVKALFQQMANEEQKHYVMIDELMQFVAKAEPGSGRWAESPEWVRLDDQLYDGWKY